MPSVTMKLSVLTDTVCTVIMINGQLHQAQIICQLTIHWLNNQWTFN